MISPKVKTVVVTRYSKKTPTHDLNGKKLLFAHSPTVEETQLFPWMVRKVSYDGYLSYRGKDDSVPMIYCGKEVFVDDSFGRTLLVYDQKGEAIGTCDLRFQASPVRLIHPEPEVRNREYQRK